MKSRLALIGAGVAVLAAFLMFLDYYHCWRCSEEQLYLRGSKLLEEDSSSDRRKGLELIRAAAETGHPEALATMGEAHLGALPEGYRPIHDSLFEKTADMEIAVSYFDRLAASERADGRALHNLGILTREGILPAGEEEEGAYFSRAAGTGYPPALYELGLRARSRGKYTQAASYFEKACQKRCLAEAALALGDLFYRGRGVVRDAEEALRWYRRGLEAAEGPTVASARNRLEIAERYLQRNPKREIFEVGYKLEGGTDEYLIYAGGIFVGRVKKEGDRVLAERDSADSVEAASMNEGLLLVLREYAAGKYGTEKDFRFELAGD